MNSEQQTPLEFLLSLMHDESVPVELRIKAAEAAAPYLHKPVTPALPKETEQ